MGGKLYIVSKKMRLSCKNDKPKLKRGTQKFQYEEISKKKEEEKHEEIKYKLICEFVFRKNSLIGFDL